MKSAALRQQIAKLQLKRRRREGRCRVQREGGSARRHAARCGGGRGGAAVVAAPAAGGRGGPPRATDTLWAVSTSLGGLMNSMQGADVPPTAITVAAVTAAQTNAARVMARWTTIRTVDLRGAERATEGRAALTIPHSRSIDALDCWSRPVSLNDLQRPQPQDPLLGERDRRHPADRDHRHRAAAAGEEALDLGAAAGAPRHRQGSGDVAR